MSFDPEEPITKNRRAPRTFEELWDRMEEKNRERDGIMRTLFTEVQGIKKGLSDVQGSERKATAPQWVLALCGVVLTGGAFYHWMV